MIHFSQHCCTIPSADYSIFHAFILGYFDHEIFAVAKGACISRFPHTQRTHGLWVEWNAASHSSFFFLRRNSKFLQEIWVLQLLFHHDFFGNFQKKIKSKIYKLIFKSCSLPERTYHCPCTRVCVHVYGCYLCISMYVYVHYYTAEHLLTY